MTEHTPGPWVVRPAPYGFDIFNQERSLWVGSTTTPIGKESLFYPPKDEVAENAALMAEAPALKCEVAELRRALLDALVTFGIDGTTRFCLVYRDVIARAECAATIAQATQP